MPVVGTAGHVDHGKSTLIERLTGRDPDRWTEEKRRGLTIDLGFAWADVNGTEVSFVDVPGHERFVKNMLAGIESVDAAMLVVAADEGWMPQTEEHAVVLDLLDIERVIVVLTKVDRVDSTDVVKTAIASKLAGLRYENASIVEVSSIEGTGLDALRESLSEIVGGIEEVGPPTPHLWIDRSFSVRGSGTVVTGTLQGGSISLDDPVVLQPPGMAARIRAIQSHERSVENAAPRRRVALNLGGVSREEVSRGTLLTLGHTWRMSERTLVSVRPARYAELDDRGAYQLHMGTGAWPIRVQLIDETAAVLHLDRPAPMLFGAPFIIRETGRRLVVGGGRVLDPAPPRRRVDLVAAADRLRIARTPDDAAAALLEGRGFDQAESLARDTGGGTVDGATWLGRDLYSVSASAALRQRGEEALDGFHTEYPLRAGMPTASLAEALSITSAALDDLIELAGWERHGPAVAKNGHEAALSPTEAGAWSELEAALQADLKVPRVKELTIDGELLAALVARGYVIRVSDDLVFLPSQLNDIESAIRDFAEPFTVSEFRQALDLSRKYAVPLLEYFDKAGVTRRRGDVRVVRPKG